MLRRQFPRRGACTSILCRHFYRPIPACQFRRTTATVAEQTVTSARDDPGLIERETTTGFLDANGDGILFFDNIYPLITAIYDPRFLLYRFTPLSHQPNRRLSRYIPPDLPITPKSIIPRPKDGGAFLRFAYDKNGISLDDVQSRIQQHLKQKVERPWFNPVKRVNAWIVRGRPWIEDLRRFPSRRLKIEFEGADITQEDLYSMFRQFGRIGDIIPASPSSKELPRYALITYVYIRSATSAKNCLHQAIVTGTKMHISYESMHRAPWFLWEWIVNHPRITIPAAAAIFALIVATIFDPIRTWTVQNKITRTWDPDSYRLIQWLRQSWNEIIPFRKEHPGHEQVWNIDENVRKIKDWISENEQNFIIVVGPKGTEKRDMVIDGVLSGRPNTLVIDCESVVEQHSDSAVIRQLAQQVGYAPIFDWLNFLSSLLDLAAQGTIGQKAGFTETLDTQVKKILNTTATALKRVALSHKPKTEKGLAQIRDEEFLEQNPQHRPVVVLDHFLHKADNASLLYDNIAKWATILVEANVAHVVFLTNDVGYSKVLASEQVLRTVTLGDKDPETAKNYVLRQLEYIENERHRQGTQRARGHFDSVEKSAKERDLDLDRCIRVLGGRLRDLAGLAQRLAMGGSPDGHHSYSRPKLMVDVLKDIVEQSASEVLKVYFLGESSTLKWTRIQAWTLVKLLSERRQASYNAILLDPVFSQDESPLRELAQAELISISSSPEGHPTVVKPGRPVFSAAFQLIANDKVFSAKMELSRLTFLAAEEKKTIDKAEEELARLRELRSAQWWEIESRIRYLLKKIQASQMNIENLETDMGKAKKVLQSEG